MADFWEQDPVADSGGAFWEQDAPVRAAGGGIPGAIDTAYKAYNNASGNLKRVGVQALPQAVLGLPALLMDANDSATNLLIRGYNAVAPKFGADEMPAIPTFRHARLLSDTGSQMADALDLPKPESKIGKMASDIGTAGTAAFGGAGLAKILGFGAQAGTKVSQFLEELAQAPKLQAAGAAGSVMAQDLAQEGGIQDPRALLAIGMVGGMTPGSMGTIAERTAGGAAQLAAPFRSVNENGFLPGVSRDVIAGKVLNKLATNPGAAPQAMDVGLPIIPNSLPTIAQVSRDPGLISAETGIRQALDNGQATSGRMGQRASEQNTARNAALDRITLPSIPVPEGGQPMRGTLEYATAKRDRAVDANMDPAFAASRAGRVEYERNPQLQGNYGLGFADTSPVLQSIERIRNSPTKGSRQAVKDAMDFAEKALTQQEKLDVTDPEVLYGIRKDLALARDGKYNTDKSDLRLAKGELQTVIGELDNAIDAAAPGYRKYLDLYAKRSIALDQQEGLRDLRDRGRVSVSDPTTGTQTPILTMGKFGVAFRKALSQGALGSGDVSRPQVGTANMSQNQLDLIARVAADLDRGSATTAATMKPPGSDTFKNLSIANVIGRVVGDNFPDTSYGKAMKTISKPLSWMYSDSDEQIGQLLVEATLDPRLASRLMRQASRYEIENVAKELAKRAGRGEQGAITSNENKR